MKVLVKPEVRMAVIEDMHYIDINLNHDLTSGVYMFSRFILPLGLTRKHALGIAIAIYTTKQEVGMNRINQLGPHGFNQYIELMTDEANILMREEIVERKER